MKYNPMLLTDFYKTCHMNMYPDNLSYITSYFTPRSSRLKNQNEVVMFGLQGVVEEYLIDVFQENFFEQPIDKIINEYHYVLSETIGKEVANVATKRIKELHQLGFLPIAINAIPEGTIVPVGVPLFEIHNTNSKFAWLVNSLETLLSTSMWHTIISATVAYQYRNIINKYYSLTVDDDNLRKSALGDFSLRGQESLESGIKSSAGFLTSFNKTATVPSIMWTSNYYNEELKNVGNGSVSTEHSVMCSNYSVDGNEVTFIKKMLVELYPNTSFSIVLDSYDYWNTVKNILPTLKEEILNHNATMFIRGDSGDPIKIVTQTVYELWDIFGGTINEKGYKVLDPHVRAIYGDSITQIRATKIYEELKSKGFAANNVALGVGSFSMQALENDDRTLSPYTRDTFGIAIKATHGLIKDNNGNKKEIFIFKNPKTDNSKFTKVSAKGLIDVRVDENNHIYMVDKISINYDRNTIMKPLLMDGVIYKDNFKNIRNRLHNNNF